RQIGKTRGAPISVAPVSVNPEVSTAAIEGAAAPGARPSCVLSVEPDILHAPAVEEAVHQERRPLYVRVPAGRAAVVKDDRSGAVLRQFSFDRPYQLLALARVGLGRLPVDQLVDLGAAVAVEVQLAAA